MSEKVLKSYCWMYSSFNIPPDFEGNCARRSQTERLIYNSYYQWVPIFLILQAIMFYVPRVLWLMMEGGNGLYCMYFKMKKLFVSVVCVSYLILIFHCFNDKVRYQQSGNCTTNIIYLGLMKFLAKGRTDRIIEDQDEKLNTLLRTFKHNLHNKYNRYAFIFFVCEILNLIIIVGK